MALTETTQAAREALRARQGAGARYDAPNAPSEDLLMSRRGAAFFARKLNELTDADFDAPSLRDNWTRRHLVAHISYHARTVAIALKGMREGLTEEEAEWRPDVALAMTLPVRALRYLYEHSNVHLNVEFRDLRPEHWEAEIFMDGRSIPVRSLPLLRAREVWIGAVHLRNGAGLRDVPDLISADP